MLSARLLHEPRRLTQLRQHAAGALRQRRVREDDLRRETGAQRVGVELRIALPGPRLLDFQNPGLDVRRYHRLLDPLDRRQIVGVDLLQAAGESRQSPCVLLERVPAEVLQQIVVRVHAVEGGTGRVNFMKIGKIIANEVAEGF